MYANVENNKYIEIMGVNAKMRNHFLVHKAVLRAICLNILTTKLRDV